jgi:EpsI family protein
MVFIGLLMLAGAGLAVAMKPTQKMADLRGMPNLETMIPESFGGWTIDKSIIPVEPSPDVQAVINKVYNQTLSRTYISPAGQRIMLSMAYGGDQSDSLRVHEPEVCYTVQGFQISGVARRQLTTKYGAFPAKTLVATLGTRVEPITYWIAVGEMVTLSIHQQKLARLRAGLSGTVADGMLIRVSSIARPDAQSYGLQQEFIEAMLASLDPRDRSRLGVGETAH